MHPFWGNVAVLTVALIFYAWRAWHSHVQGHKERVLRSRVAHMLWVMAECVDGSNRLSAD